MLHAHEISMDDASGMYILKPTLSKGNENENETRIWKGHTSIWYKKY
jgi:hypothetical protein